MAVTDPVCPLGKAIWPRISPMEEVLEQRVVKCPRPPGQRYREHHAVEPPCDQAARGAAALIAMAGIDVAGPANQSRRL